MKRPLLICGTRSFAEEVADFASDIGLWEVAGFVENLDRERTTQTLAGSPILWVDELVELAATHVAICALVTTERSRFTDQVEAHGMEFATLAHPSAHVSSASTLGPGTLVSPHVVVAAHTIIGSHVILNRGVLVGHHTKIGDHCSILPGANVAGNCRLGAAVFVGMGATILDNLEVGAGAVVGAGSVVTRDVAPGTKVLGVPARPVDGEPRG